MLYGFFFFIYGGETNLIMMPKSSRGDKDEDRRHQIQRVSCVCLELTEHDIVMDYS